MFAFDPTQYPGLPTRGRSRAVPPPTVAPPSAPTPIYGFGGGRRRASITAAANVDGSGSVHTLAEAVAAKASPKAGGLSQLFAHSEVSSRAPSRAPSAERKKGKKKKKKSNKATKDKRVLDLGRFDADFEAVKKGTLRPVDGGNDWKRLAEPDWTFMKRAVSSTSSSRSSSPPRPSALSSLLSQAHPGDLASVAGDSDTSVSSENGDTREHAPTETYEVALDGDYVNAEAPERRQMRADDFEPLRCLGKGT